VHDEAALVEITVTVGHYTKPSTMANTAGVPPEAHWLASARRRRADGHDGSIDIVGTIRTTRSASHQWCG